MMSSEAQEDSAHKHQVEEQSRRSNNFDWIIEPNELSVGGLALGNIRFAENFKQLQAHSIGAIISVFGEKDLVVDPSIKHFRILISDNSRQNIKCFFSTSYQFLGEHLSKTNVLVHCQAGVSRSASIVASYLMKSQGLTDKEALDFIRKRRPNICPNKGFLKQLKQYSRQLEEEKRKSESPQCTIF